MTDRPSVEGSRRRILYLFLGLLLNVFLGTVYSWSVFRVPVEELFGVGAVAGGLPYMIMLATFSLTLPVAGVLVDRLGLRKLATIGGLALAAAWLGGSFMPGIGGLTLVWGIVGGVGVGLAYVSSLTIGRVWFPERRGLAMGVVLSGFGMSPLVTAPLAEAALLALGVRGTFRLVGVVFGVLIPLLVSPFRIPRPGELPSPKAGRSVETESQERGLAPSAAIRRREFIVLWVSLLLGSVIGLGAIAITAPYAQHVVGLSAPAAAVAVSFLALFNGVGRPLFGFLTDHLGLRRTAVLAFSLTGAASLLLMVDPADGVVSFGVAFAVFWLLLGGWLAIAPAATATLFGSRHYGGNYGIVFQAYGLGAVAGTMVSGRLNEVFGSYRSVVTPILLVSIAGVLLAWWGFGRLSGAGVSNREPQGVGSDYT